MRRRCQQGLSTDARPEVRNSGVRTLFSVVAGQGARLSRPAWEECLWQMLFPLLRSVHHTAATSSREEVPLLLLVSGARFPAAALVCMLPTVHGRHANAHAVLLHGGCTG